MRHLLSIPIAAVLIGLALISGVSPSLAHPPDDPGIGVSVSGADPILLDGLAFTITEDHRFTDRVLIAAASGPQPDPASLRKVSLPMCRPGKASIVTAWEPPAFRAPPRLPA